MYIYIFHILYIPADIRFYIFKKIFIIFNQYIHVIHNNALYIFNGVIAPFIDISKYNVKYLAMRKMHMYAGAISKLFYGFASVRPIIHS